MQFRRDTPERIILEIRKRYASYLADQDVPEEWHGSELEQKISAGLKPGDWLRHLREAHGMTQEELGRDLGGVSGSRISDWESHRRSVSKAMAKRLSNIFNVSSERFI
jgi:predicted transcriptional regulator